MKTTKPENFRKWLDALRSGDFRQTTGALRHTQDTIDHLMGHCCLGVACAISDLGEWKPGESFPGRLEYVVKDEMNSQLMPEPVLEWLGIDEQDAVRVSDGYTLDVAKPDIDFGVTFHSVAELNDQGSTFEEIADLLEKEYLT